ncbi:MAG TPA: hypothetical protein VJ550_11595 [Geomonas sp.]|nr:hypothetical protein [Geomonas sp.]
MNRLRSLKAIVLVLAAVAVFGCKSKQEGPAAPAAGTQQPQAVKSISGEATTGAMASSPKDKADAEVAAGKVLSQMEAGDFATIYKEAAPSFRQIGKQEDFVAKFSATRQKIGPLSGQKEASFVTMPDQTYVIVYHMENPHWNTERRLTFTRGNGGKMELYGLNQHDEPKAVAR